MFCLPFTNCILQTGIAWHGKWMCYLGSHLFLFILINCWSEGSYYEFCLASYASWRTPVWAIISSGNVVTFWIIIQVIKCDFAFIFWFPFCRTHMTPFSSLWTCMRYVHICGLWLLLCCFELLINHTFIVFLASTVVWHLLITCYLP